MKPLTDRKLDKAFRDKLAGLEVVPDKLNWIGVEAGLDSVSYWRNRKILRVGALGLLALLMVSASGFYLWNTSSNNTAESVRQYENSIFSSLIPSIEAKSFEIPVNDIKQPEIVRSRHENNSPDVDFIQAEQVSVIDNPVIPNRNPLQLDNIWPLSESDNTTNSYSLANLGIETLTQPSTDYATLNAVEPWQINLANEKNFEPLRDQYDIEWEKVNSGRVSGFHIGPTFIVQNTWLSHNMINTFSDRYHFKKELTINTAYGLNVGFDFNSKFGIQAEYLISSMEGQNYSKEANNDPRFGLPDDGTYVKLNYTRIPFTFKLKSSNLNKYAKIPSVVNYMVGLQYGRLNWVNIGASMPFVRPENFNTHEWGLVVGLEYDFYPGKNYSVSLGVRGTANTELSHFPMIFHDQYQTAHTFTLGLNARVNYIIPTGK